MGSVDLNFVFSRYDRNSGVIDHTREMTSTSRHPNTQFCGIKGCGSAVCPPSIISKRLKLPQQIICRRKGSLSESPNHLKYWENILISQFYEQFSRSSWILGHFWKFKKFQTLRTQSFETS